MKLQTLKKRYVVFPLEGSSSYAIYEKRTDGGGVDYKITVKEVDGDVFVGDHRVDGVCDLRSKMETYKASLPYPVRFYDPLCRDGAKHRGIVEWYLGSLGFANEGNPRGFGDSEWWVARADLGSIRTASERIGIHWDDFDSTQGRVMVDCGGYAFMEWAFTDAPDAIKTINSWLATVVPMDLASMFSLVTRLGSEHQEKMDYIVSELSGMSVKCYDYKCFIIEKLENALKSLKNE